MVGNDYTVIRVKRETAKMLQEIGKKSETYDDVVRRLMDGVSKDN